MNFTPRKVYYWPKFSTFWIFEIFASQTSTLFQNLENENGSKIFFEIIFGKILNPSKRTGKTKFASEKIK
jgi:hypothetical protein